MALVIPIGKSTYGDATTMPDGHLSTYILAQLPDDASLTWVRDVRTLLTREELKWKDFQARREEVQAKAQLWRRLLISMKTATIVIIRPSDVESDIRALLDAQGAEYGTDYDRRTLVDACATALVRDTPVAYLPNRLSEALNLYPLSLYVDFEKFAPDQIKKQIGGKLRDAKIFAARAHATFDVPEASMPNRSGIDKFRSPGAMLVLRELLATQRGFDEEHPRSVAVLNEAAETIAKAMGEKLQFQGEVLVQPLVQEFSSKDVDILQAADIASGWAHELLALGNERALGDTFGRVLINGVLMS